MKAAAIVLLIAVIALMASSLLWLRASKVVASEGDSTVSTTVTTLFTEFERAHRADHEIDLGAKYAGRLDLIDPRLALPTWHKHPRDEGARVAHCSKIEEGGGGGGGGGNTNVVFTDASLAKAYRRCANANTNNGDAENADIDIEAPPFVHPSGKSYAALALQTQTQTPRSAAWTRRHVRAFHVLELASLDATALDADDRALASIDFHSWEALTRGDWIVLAARAQNEKERTAEWLLIADRGPLGLAKLRIYPRATWDAFARHESIALAARAKSALCLRPVSPELCLQRVAAGETHRSLFLASTSGSAGLVGLSLLVLAIAWRRERRRVHRDRIHVLRTLTHELRTPATSLRIDIEPLRAAYDDLPAGCQEPLLRISDGIERLHRVLHRSARYMALFETSEGGETTGIVQMHEVPSVREMFESLVDEWPEGVTLLSKEEDGPATTDPEWLAVAVRNLVENAARHGKPPIAVTWRREQEHLIVRVSDQGSSPDFSLRRSAKPWERDAKSEGLGLGLAIVDRVAHLLGGKLTHESTPTTVFQLRLPLNVKVKRGGTSS